MAISHVATDRANGFSSAPSITLSNITPAANNLLHVAISVWSASHTASAEPGDLTKLHESEFTSGGSFNERGAAYYKLLSGSETTFSWTMGGNVRWEIVCTEWTGNATSSVLDQAAEDVTNIGTATQTSPSGTVTPTADGIAISAHMCKDGRDWAGTQSLSNSFSLTVDTSGDINGTVMIGSLVYTGTASKTTTLTTDDTGDFNYGIIATFKEAGGAAANYLVSKLGLMGVGI